MEEVRVDSEKQILVIGEDKLTFSLVSALLKAGHKVALLTTVEKEDVQGEMRDSIAVHGHNLEVTLEWHNKLENKLVFLLTKDCLQTKINAIRQIQKNTISPPLIGVNLESIHLDEVQAQIKDPQMVFGVNWTYPVELTLFAEIIVNQRSDRKALIALKDWLTSRMYKDPFVVNTGLSIRARMMAAFLREALYLVENGYASVESVDRACRNDAGYYLPFVGNFRYMDLMGTYAYGMVMSDLNPELSNMEVLPDFLERKKDNQDFGMDEGKGFYSYKRQEKENWESVFKEFSQEIHQLILRYPHESLDY